MELLALVELAVKLVVEETVNEVLVMLLACRARPKSTEGPRRSRRFKECNEVDSENLHAAEASPQTLVNSAAKVRRS